MYEWLSESLQGQAHVVTANRRLARDLRDAYTGQQLGAGLAAWPSPRIYSWQDWLRECLRSVSAQESLPTRINQYHSQLLWERCLAKELPDSTARAAGLVRLARDAWQRLADWQVDIRELARSVQSEDQRLFASVAGRYLAILEHEHWVDDAGLAALVVAAIDKGTVAAPDCLTFAGFERARPVVEVLQQVLIDKGCEVRTPPTGALPPALRLQCFETPEAELRAAGAWAREQLATRPGSRIAIISGDLEQQGVSRQRLVREGLAPGWQYAGHALRHSVNVSYGRRLTEFPAIGIALLVLRWLERDLDSRDLSQLLLSPLLGATRPAVRGRLELRLRELPDRRWSPTMVNAALRGYDRDDEATAWFGLVSALAKARQELRTRAAPADWATRFDEILRGAGWPGVDSLDSHDFQLVNRWRDLLNDLARMDLVSPLMTLSAALRRLELIAAETVFQPESRHARVQLLGPLEAAGARFDAVWLSGLTASQWPPPGNPSPLLSRRLQRERGMPDAAPADTLAYATATLQLLLRSAPLVVCSYPASKDDAEQTPTTLIDGLEPSTGQFGADPGWHAASLAALCSPVDAPDPVPALREGERVRGADLYCQIQRAFGVISRIFRLSHATHDVTDRVERDDLSTMVPQGLRQFCCRQAIL